MRLLEYEGSGEYSKCDDCEVRVEDLRENPCCKESFSEVQWRLQ